MSFIHKASEIIIKEYLTAKGLFNTLTTMEEECMRTNPFCEKFQNVEDELKLKIFLNCMKSFFTKVNSESFRCLLEAIISYYRRIQTVSELFELHIQDKESITKTDKEEYSLSSSVPSKEDDQFIPVGTLTTDEFDPVDLQDESPLKKEPHYQPRNNVGYRKTRSAKKELKEETVVADQELLESIAAGDLPFSSVKDEEDSEEEDEGVFEQLVDECKRGRPPEKELPVHYCYMCPTSFTMAWQLADHYEKCHGEKQYNCRECLEMFDTERCRRKHEKNAHRKSVMCETCGEVTKDLKAHSLRHLPERPRCHQCHICQKSFFNLHYLKRHIKDHTKVKNHICHVCGNAFKTMSELKHHQLVHSDDKPHHCEVCNRTFRTKGQLKKHACSKPTCLKPYKCDLCPAAYSRLRVLKAHYKLHTGEKPFKCIRCGESFSLMRHLKSHMQKEHIKQVFNCHLCDRKFKWRSSRSDHIKQCHTIPSLKGETVPRFQPHIQTKPIIVNSDRTDIPNFKGENLPSYFEPHNQSQPIIINSDRSMIIYPQRV